ADRRTASDELVDSLAEVRKEWRLAESDLTARLSKLEASLTTDLGARITREVESLRAASESLESRLSGRLRTGIAEVESTRDRLLEKMRQDFHSEDSELQRLLERQTKALDSHQKHMDEELQGLRHLEQNLRSESFERQGLADRHVRDFNAVNSQINALAGQHKTIEEALPYIQSRLETATHKLRDVDGRCQDLTAGLQHNDDQVRETAAQASHQLNQVAQKLEKQVADQDDLLRGEVDETFRTAWEEQGKRFATLSTGESQERQGLEARAEELLQMGLQKLASEVAARIEEERQQQLASLSALDRRVGDVLEARVTSAERRTEACEVKLGATDMWRREYLDRQAAQEQQLGSMTEALRRVFEQCQEIPVRLEERLEQARLAAKEDLAACALSTFQGE
ncbi:unnamed protein product, partial [Polarella glacialis]